MFNINLRIYIHVFLKHSPELWIRTSIDYCPTFVAYANISSLPARRESFSKKFFRNIMNNPDNPLFDLLPSPREATVIGRLQSAHLLPVPRTRTNTIRYDKTILMCAQKLTDAS